MNFFSSAVARRRVIGSWAVAMLAMAAPVLALRDTQIVKPQQAYAPAPPTLEVREFSGDFTQWGKSAALGDGGLTKEFRWRTTRKDAALARYEVAYGFLSSVRGELPLPKPLGAHGFFSINFTPLLKDLAGSPSPKKLFHVQLTLLDRAGKPLSPASQIVALTYQPPAGGTRLDSAMAVVLKSVKCIKTTSGSGSDEMNIGVIGGRFTHGGVALTLHSQLHEGFDPGDAILPDKVVHTFTGPSFAPEFTVMVGLAEDDDRLNFGNLAAGGGGPENGPNVLKDFRAHMCELDPNAEDDCIGDPQVLPITAADWNTAVVKKQVVTKKLVFTGDGGRYEVVFELRKS